MTPSHHGQQFNLAAELFGILSSATAPLRPDSFGKILHALGVVNADGSPVTEKQIDLALEGLVVAGRIERVWRRGTERYRPMRTKLVGRRNPRSATQGTAPFVASVSRIVVGTGRAVKP